MEQSQQCYWATVHITKPANVDCNLWSPYDDGHILNINFAENLKEIARALISAHKTLDKNNGLHTFVDIDWWYWLECV